MKNQKNQVFRLQVAADVFMMFMACYAMESCEFVSMSRLLEILSLALPKGEYDVFFESESDKPFSGVLFYFLKEEYTDEIGAKHAPGLHEVSVLSWKEFETPQKFLESFPEIKIISMR